MAEEKILWGTRCVCEINDSREARGSISQAATYYMSFGGMMQPGRGFPGHQATAQMRVSQIYKYVALTQTASAPFMKETPGERLGPNAGIRGARAPQFSG